MAFFRRRGSFVANKLYFTRIRPSAAVMFRCPRSSLEMAKRKMKKGSGCSTAVEHMPRDREVMSSNPTGCWAFSFLCLISSAFLIWSLMQVQHYWLSFKMLSHAAWGKASFICTDWAKNIKKEEEGIFFTALTQSEKNLFETISGLPEAQNGNLSGTDFSILTFTRLSYLLFLIRLTLAEMVVQ